MINDEEIFYWLNVNIFIGSEVI